jgi:hypothetical protein
LAVNPYRRYGFCKVNGVSFNFGGDDELKFTFNFAVGKETAAPAPLSANSAVLPALAVHGQLGNAISKAHCQMPACPRHDFQMCILWPERGQWSTLTGS